MTRMLDEVRVFLATTRGDIGIDLETTALHPAWGDVRCVQLAAYPKRKKAGETPWGLFVDLWGPRHQRSDWRKNLKAVLEMILKTKRGMVAFSATFEMTWFTDAGVDVNIDDVKLCFSAQNGGTIGLAQLVKDTYGVDLDKSFQKYGWAQKVLSQEAIGYAIDDSVYTLMLWRDYLADPLWETTSPGYEVMKSSQPAIVDMQLNGLQLDKDAHEAFVSRLERWDAKFEKSMREIAPGIKNLGSAAQVSDWLNVTIPKKVWRRMERTPKDKTRVSLKRVCVEAALEVYGDGYQDAVGYPFLRLYFLRQRHSAFLKMFGRSLAAKVAEDGLIHGSLNIGAAQTGRMSSSGPNLQNVPAGKSFRRMVVRRRYRPASPGAKWATLKKRLLLCADYNQIEVRIGGELAGCETIRRLIATGADLHLAMAAEINRIPMSEVTGAQRRRAKGTTFGIQYGMGPEAIGTILLPKGSASDRYDLGVLRLEEWGDTFPAMMTWREAQFQLGKLKGYLDLPSGRRIKLGWDIRPSICYNYPVQGSAADVMYRGLYHVRRLFLEQEIDADLLCVVHDEILADSSPAHETIALRALEEGMSLGYQDVFPGANNKGLVTAYSGADWAEAKG
jgi:DNA polymerase I-like protein with 3'-5' exonuclease and polymerase domains